MTIEQAIHERLVSLGPLTSLVGTRIYQLKLPQKPTLPAVRMQQISEIDRMQLRGPDGLTVTRLQIDAYASELSGSDPYASATAVASAIHGDGLGDNATGLHGWRGELGGSPAAYFVWLIDRIDRRPEYEAGELRLVRIRQDYRVYWKELM